jgi:hypothetical protein
MELSSGGIDGDLDPAGADPIRHLLEPVEATARDAVRAPVRIPGIKSEIEKRKI